jgi:hypothetical protein
MPRVSSLRARAAGSTPPEPRSRTFLELNLTLYTATKERGIDSTRGHTGGDIEPARGPDMSNIILLFLCMAVGMALRRSGRVPDNADVAINTFIIYVSLPALTLLAVTLRR